jgi:hypothetical protein
MLHFVDSLALLGLTEIATGASLVDVGTERASPACRLRSRGPICA